MNDEIEAKTDAEAMTEEKPSEISVSADIIPAVNFALQQNGMKIVQSVTITNSSADRIENAELRISTTPEICVAETVHIDLIPAGSSFELRDCKLEMNGEMLASLTERLTASLKMELTTADGRTAAFSQEISALAYDEWHGSSVYPELLSAFVTPNHPQISAITARAAELMGKWTGDPSLDAYQSEDPNRVMKQAAAVYAAIQEQNIVYAVAPASFEPIGQRVRLCDAIMQQKMGNCLDLSLMFVSALEAIGLHPLLILKTGHAFAGLWLEDKLFPESVQDDPSLVTKRLAGGVSEMAVVECTAMCSGKNISFDEAYDAAASQLPEADIIIDVSRARLSGIKPMPLRIKTEDGWRVERPQLKEKDLTAAPKTLTGAIDTSSSEELTPATRKLMWERKLLDIGLRNTLINLRLSRTLVPVLTTSIDALEDALANGEDFTILPKPADVKASEMSFETISNPGDAGQIIDSEFKNHRLRSAMTETELTKTVKELYRAAKTAMEENGANTLYLAMGVLKWFESPRSTKPRYAPLVMIPVELVRRSAAQGYVLRLRDDDPQMNITLLEKLKQDFGIQITGLDPLPTDEHGIDTRRVFTIIRKAVMQQKNWDVLEAACIGIFSFSQFVMWNDIKNRSDELEKNKIVKSLIDGKLSWNAEEMKIGERVPEDDVFLPLPADASQLFAIEAATSGESFVLHGPPGTGKSQTITALIANALAKGRTVLFVAEKMAALEVVQRRLDKIGLGPFCLELHSNKSKKRAVLEQLRQASEVTKNQPPESYSARAKEIAGLRAELDKYSIELHKKQKCGKTVFELINEYEAAASSPDIANISAQTADSMTAEKLIECDAAVQKLIAAAKACGHPKDHPLSAVGTTVYSQKLRMELPDRIRDFLRAAEAVREPLEKLSDAFGSDTNTFADCLKCARLADEAVLWYTLPQSWCSSPQLYPALNGIKELCSRQTALNTSRASLMQLWKPDVFTLDAAALLAEYRAASGKWFLAKSMGYGSLAKRLSPYANRQISKEELEGVLTALNDYKTESNAVAALYSQYSAMLEGYYNGEQTDWNTISTAAGKAEESAKAMCELSGGEGFRMNICGNRSYEDSIRKLNTLWQTYVSKRLDVFGQLEITSVGGIKNETELCTAILDHSDELRELIAWNAAAKEARECGLDNLVDAYISGLSHNDVMGAYKKSISRMLTVRAVDASPVLGQFTGTVFDEQIHRFRQLDSELEKLTRQEIYCRLAAKVPDFTREAAQSSELGILQKAIRSGGRGLSIRKLFDQIPEMLPRLCPCMLMSPISAAQYLDPEREPFDVVVFDEASQLPTCKAVGVLARGKNAVIVGDPKQMPPTSFFSSTMVDEDNMDAEDLESILDDCLALNMPQTHLLWHYRSRHESLIAFSNHHFYENKLLTFPSVNDREAMVRLVHVDGLFERGKNRQNRAEAEAIVAELSRRCHDKQLSKKSVGVVTFNINQQNLIDDLLTEAFKSDPQLESWASHGQEPLFIKNLENVQGDERDVILFSVCYGPDSDGKVSMNFGPLNRDGGWRRLNVAVSRARCEMVVFSTLTGDMIDLSRTSAEGVAALKAFLDYASGKQLAHDSNSIGSSAKDKNGIADAICAELEEKGFRTDRLVGHSEYKIDIGVIDPNDPDKYLVGIMLDGSSYGSAKTTRDRELAQESVLSGLGWEIIRVWSMDWWDNRKKEITRIFDKIVEIQNRPEPDPDAEDEDEAVQPTENEASAPTGKLESAAVPTVKRAARAKAYRCAELAVRNMTADEFASPENRGELVRRIGEIIRVEAPISETLLTKRLFQSCGITRTSPKTTAALSEAIASMNLMKTSDGDRLFYWSEGQFPGSYTCFRASGEGESKRDVLDVPSEEAVNAVCYVLYDMISMSEEDLIRESAKLLQYTRSGSNINSLFGSAVSLSLRLGNIIKKPNGLLTLSDRGKEKAEQLAKEITFIEK